MAMFKSDGKMIFMIFIGVIITAVFMVSIADQASLLTSTSTITNGTFTSAATNSTVTLPGRSNITAVTVHNASDGTDWTANFSVNTTNAQGTLGIFLATGGVTGTGFPAESINVSYTYEPQGYIRESAGRNMAALIVLFAALAIVVFVIVVIFKFGSINDMMASFNRRRTR